jgi:PBSX family phage terminase large subunit
MLEGQSSAPEYGVIDFIIVKNKFGDVSKIGFRNCEQGRERFQGVSLDFVWFDEEPPAEIYDECLLRLLDRGGRHFVTMTPIKGRSWVYNRIYLKKDSTPNLCVFTMSWADNPHLKKAEIKNMEKSLSPEVLESRKFGRFIASAGLVFAEFDDKNIVVPFPVKDMRKKYISIDPGYNNPTAVLWACSDTADNIYIVADYEVSKQMIRTHINEIKRQTAELGWEIGDTKVLIDSAANQRTAGSPVSPAEQYRNGGIAADTNVNKAVFDGIMAVKSLFCNACGERKLFVFKNCVNLINELRGYFWDKGDSPQQHNDHTIDALRYLIMDIRRTERTEKTPLGILGIAKQKMIRKIKEEKYG